MLECTEGHSNSSKNTPAQNPKTFRQRPVQARNFHVLNSLSLRCLGIPKLLYLVVIQEDSLSPPGLLLIPFLKSIL